jgi:hypothetical protein
MKKQKSIQKVVHRNDNLDATMKKKKEKNQEIINKLEQAKIRRLELSERQSQKLHEMINKEKKKYHRVIENKQDLYKDKEESKHYLLENQLNILEKTNMKEESITLNRQNIQ